MIAVLTANSVQIIQLSGSEMRTIQTLNKKVHSFCVNNAVFKAMNSAGQTITQDQLCVATTDKQLFFFDMQIN